ncbi:MAG: hypothetical protein ACE14W_00950 [Candidatus Velamenicoccus archaeovorus]
MSKRRRKGRSAADRRPSPASGGTAKGLATREPPERARTEPQRAEVPGFLRWMARGTGESRLPSVSRSLGRGLLIVGSSPPLLAITLLFVLGGWLGMVALGLEGPAGRLVYVAALPPIGTYWDTYNGVAIFGFGVAGLVWGGVFLAIRALFVAVVTGLVVQALEAEGRPAEGALRGLRAFPIVLAVNVLSMSLMIAGTVVLPFLGPGLGFFGSVAILVATMFFFVYVPAAAIRERRGLQETMRRAARASLMPGSRNLLFAMLYVFLSLPLLVAFAPSSNDLTVNPSLASWVYALLANVLHVGFLAGFTYRWIAGEPDVPEQPVKLRRR